MDAKVVAALPPIDALPASVRIAADQDQHGQFRALLAAPVWKSVAQIIIDQWRIEP